MQQFSETLKDIYENGIDHRDRTGKGRRSVFGRLLRFDVSGNKIPLVTTRKTFIRGAIEELLWFIRGSTDNNELVEKNVHIWDQWALTKEQLNENVDKMPVDENTANVLKEQMKGLVGAIGPMYGWVWRNAPARLNGDNIVIAYSDLSSDRQSHIDKLYEDKEQLIAVEIDPESITKDELASIVFGGCVDQLHELIKNLKARPYSSRHCITAWLPSLIPDETKACSINIMSGKGSLAPCHVFQQYLVKPPKEEGGKMRISLMMTQR